MSIFTMSDRRRGVIRYDPNVLTYENQPSAGIDTFLESDTPTTNYGTSATLQIGTVGGIRLSSLWKDPFTGLSNVHVLSAKLSLYVNSSPTFTVDFYALLRDWVEAQATHNIWKTSNNWTTAGALSDGNDKEASAMATSNFLTSEGSGSEHIVDLSTSKVEAWINGTQSNFGLIAIAGGALLNVGSSDSGTPSLRPKIVVKYLQK